MNILIKQATIHPVSSPSFVGDVFVKNGKINKIGTNLIQNELPHPYHTIDARNLLLYPGLIDVHTHLGLYDEGTGWAGNDANEKSESMTPHIRAIDGVYPLDSGFRDAIESGVTCVHIMPGSANIIGGTTSVIKTHGKNIEKMILRETAGLKIALGENPKKHHSDSGDMTRMGIMGLLRETFLKAKYDLSQTEEQLPRYKPIIKALKREIPVRIHAHRADDIISAVRFAKEFHLDLRIEHCTEGHLISDELKEYSDSLDHGLHVSVGPTMTRRSKIELRNKSWSVYRKLQDAGIHISISTDHPYVPIQYLNVSSALSVREGLTTQEALYNMTMNPAKNLGVSEYIGSIEVGKDADLVLWNGDIFHFLSKPIMTMINGEIVYSSESLTH